MQLSKVTEADNERFRGMIGQKVWKKKVWKNGHSPSKEPNPFKSGSKVNTVKGIVQHEHLNCLAFTFEEDDSYVACHQCNIAPESEYLAD